MVSKIYKRLCKFNWDKNFEIHKIKAHNKPRTKAETRWSRILVPGLYFMYFSNSAESFLCVSCTEGCLHVFQVKQNLEGDFRRFLFPAFQVTSDRKGKGQLLLHGHITRKTFARQKGENNRLVVADTK